MLLEFYQVDRERAKIVLDAIDQYAGAQNSHDFTNGTWADFLRYRYSDGGVGYAIELLGDLSLLMILTSSRLFFPFLIYSLSLDLSQQDIEMVDDITFPAGKALVLVNDVFSYDKEVCQLESADTSFNNGVAFIMKERNIGVAEAKKVILEEEIPAYEQEFLERFRSYVVDNDPRKSAHMTKYLEAVAYMISGNWYWSAYADRYFNYNVPRAAAPASSNPDLTAPLSIETRKIESQAGTLVDLVPVTDGSEVTARAGFDGNQTRAPPTSPSDEVRIGILQTGNTR